MRDWLAGRAAAFSAFLNNDPSIHNLQVPDAATAARLRAQQIASLLRYTPYMLLANVLIAMILVVAFRNSSVAPFVTSFSLGLSVLVGFQYIRWRSIRKLPPRTSASSRAPRRAILNAAILGSIWAVPPIAFVATDGSSSNLLVASLCVGMICGGAFALAPVPAASMAFVLPIWLGSVIGALKLPDAFDLIALLTVFLFVIVRSTYSMSAMIAERLVSNFEQEKQRETIGLLLGEFEENASDWLWEIDEAGRLTHVSPSLFKIFNVQPSEVIGHMALGLLQRHNAQDAKGERNLEAFKAPWRQGRAFRDTEIWIDTPVGRQCWSLTGRPIKEKDKLTGYRGFCTNVTRRRENEERISQLARYDSLTGLANRVLFSEHLAATLERAAHAGKAFYLLSIDLDGFKDVNDTFGHAVGDRLLSEVGARLKACTGKGGFSARLGGDEFAVIQTDAESLPDAGALADALIADLSRPFEIDGFCIHIGASVGIVQAPEHGPDFERLMINADLALYRAKAAGKNVWRAFAAHMDEEARARRKLEEDLRSAIANGEFRLMFQPLVTLATKEVHTLEALLRWHHPERGDVSPAEFIPLAEETGLIFAIGEWVIDEACRIAASWPDHVRVAINLSPAQFHSLGLLPAIRRSLSTHRLPPHRLELEITESVLVANVERVQLILSALASTGVQIALDDFGTGYSSLAYIRQIRFDKIKIDRSFVREISTDRKCTAIVRAVIALAIELDMLVTAEGVETEEQVRFLEREGCIEVQGYYFSRPVEAREAPSLFARKLSRDELAA